MRKSILTFTQYEANRLLATGFSYHGVPYHADYYPSGARFTLIKIPGVTITQMEKAARQIRRDRDVVGAIEYAEIQQEGASE